MAPPIRLGVAVDLGSALTLLRSLSGKAADLRPWFNDVVDPDVTRFYEEEFATEGLSGTGVKWKTWAPRTVKLRARPGHGRGGILRDTNRMWSSFVKPVGPMTIRVLEPQEYVRGTRDRKAVYHQEGTSRMPARPIVPKNLPPTLVSHWEGSLIKYLTGG